jgi:hypothetical protein
MTSATKMRMIKSHRIAVSLLFLAATLTAAATAQTGAQKAFTTLKTMPGRWEGTASNGQPVQVTFKVVSGGTAVMSEIQGYGPENMISMFNMDGASKLLMTHYCGVGNQPRMQASVSPDGKIFTFNFVDATNLYSPASGHMQKMVLTLLDDNHHTEDWTFVDHDKEMKEVFDLRRKS